MRGDRVATGMAEAEVVRTEMKSQLDRIEQKLDAMAGVKGSEKGADMILVDRQSYERFQKFDADASGSPGGRRKSSGGTPRVKSAKKSGMKSAEDEQPGKSANETRPPRNSGELESQRKAAAAGKK